MGFKFGDNVIFTDHSGNTVSGGISKIEHQIIYGNLEIFYDIYDGVLMYFNIPELAIRSSGGFFHKLPPKNN